MRSLRDAVMLAMLPELYRAQPRLDAHAIVAHAYEFADAVMYQRAKDAEENPWLTGQPDARSGAETCVTPYKAHRWNPVTKMCDRCRALPTTSNQKHAAQRARREALRAHRQLELVKEAIR